MGKSSESAIRQTEIAIRLYLGGKINVKRLAEEFDVSDRMVQKYMQYAKEHFGNDLKWERDGTYYLINREKNEKIKMFEEQLNIQFANALSAAIIEDEDYEESVENMVMLRLNCKKLDREFFNKIMSKFYQKHASIRITYTHSSGKTEQLEIFLLKLVFIEKYWYLIGKDVKDEKIKIFYVHNIKEIEYGSSTQTTEERKEALKQIQDIKTPWFDLSEEKDTVELLVEGDAYYYFKRLLPVNVEIMEDNGKNMKVKMHYSHEKEVIILVKRWLPDIHILNNNELKEKLRKMLMKYLEEK